MRLFAPFTRFNHFTRTGLLLASVLLLAALGWSQAGADLETIRSRATAGDLEAQNALGNAYTNGLPGLKPDFGEAFKWYQEAGNKGYAPAQFNLGLVLHKHGKVDEAISAYRQAIAIDSSYTAAHHNLAALYAEKGMLRDAQQELEITIDLDPNYEEAERHLQNIRRLLGE